MDYYFSEISKPEDIPEISSTTSRSKNMIAFKKKICSRFLKYITHIVLILFSFSLLVLVAILARGGAEILHKLEFDLASISQTMKNMTVSAEEQTDKIPEYYNYNYDNDDSLSTTTPAESLSTAMPTFNDSSTEAN